jgi:energy-coupling factor transporter transmembrane protein EcfT
MLLMKRGGRSQRVVLVEDSPLRPLDPRTKLAMALCASLAVMLPLERMVAFMAFCAVVLLWARLLPEAARQVWRLKWVLVILFILDWLLVDLNLAIVVSLRLILLAGVFTLFFSTTTASEFGLALERLRAPYRYAFSLSLAFQSLGLLGDEWNTIREAQRARGVFNLESGVRKLLRSVRDLIAFTVPAVVTTTKRAWSMTEAAYARGFDSPYRKPYRRLKFSWYDWVLLAVTAAVAVLMFWR